MNLLKLIDISVEYVQFPVISKFVSDVSCCFQNRKGPKLHISVHCCTLTLYSSCIATLLIFGLGSAAPLSFHQCFHNKRSLWNCTTLLWRCWSFKTRSRTAGALSTWRMDIFWACTLSLNQCELVKPGCPGSASCPRVCWKEGRGVWEELGSQEVGTLVMKS